MSGYVFSVILSNITKFSILLALVMITPWNAFAQCGDGRLGVYEQCDDGNMINGDGCSSVCQNEGDTFPVMVYKSTPMPRTPDSSELPLVSSITHHGITWTFRDTERVGRFVNGDYYVVGEAVIIDISPTPTPGNGRHGSQINILPNRQKTGFDDRVQSNRYDSSLRVYPPIELTPGSQLVSSRSQNSVSLPAVLRPNDTCGSPVASVSILTSVDRPQPLDAFRPSYAQGETTVYLARNIQRSILPRLKKIDDTPPLDEFEGYLRRPWIDDVFFSFAVPAEYQACYGRENGYMMSFIGLLLTLDFSEEEKEPLVVYLTQYGIDLHGLVRQGHSGWQAHGGHGSGRKFPIVLAGILLGDMEMQHPQAEFGEDMQTIWVTETPPAGQYTASWHKSPVTVVYGGHIGKDGESRKAGWGPYEHLPPSQWESTLGTSYRRCCTSISWVGQALAARLIPGMLSAWHHPQFFAYVDRWMTPEDAEDLDRIASEAGYTVQRDFQQGTAWRILSGGGYKQPWTQFIDNMWQAYRNSDASIPNAPLNLNVDD